MEYEKRHEIKNDMDKKRETTAHSISFAQPKNIYLPETLAVLKENINLNANQKNWLPFATHLIALPNKITLSHHLQTNSFSLTGNNIPLYNLIYDGPNAYGAHILICHTKQHNSLQPFYTFHIITTPLHKESIFGLQKTQIACSSGPYPGQITALALHQKTNTFCFHSVVSEQKMVRIWQFYSRIPQWRKQNHAQQQQNVFLKCSLFVPESLRNLSFITQNLLLGMSENGNLYKIVVKEHEQKCTKINVIGYNNDHTVVPQENLLLKTVVMYKQLLFFTDKYNTLYRADTQEVGDDTKAFLLHPIAYNVAAEKLFAYNNAIYAQTNNQPKINRQIRPIHTLTKLPVDNACA